uniref:ANAPC4_WD40 domain-containing protein n=1 Tax=Panagrolaimus sp. JU765 TaxID=591449 RepID=A0AC34QCU6_9BILA
MIVSQKSNSEETNVENLALSWHIFRDFLAVSSYKSNDGGEIGFFTKQGGKSFFKSKKRQFTRGNQIIWHTKQPILLIGWDNGKLSLIDPIKGIEEDITGSDLTEICVLCWNSESEIAYVGDINGKIASFKIDPEDFSKSKFLNKTNFREEFPVSIVSKNVKIKPTSAQFSTRKLAKQEAFNDSDALLLSSLSETKKRAVSLYFYY